MKKIFIFIVTIFYTSIFSNDFTFKFCSYKTINDLGGELRKDFLYELKNRFNVNVFIETGTAAGSTILQGVDIFDQLYTIELDSDLYHRAFSKLNKFTHVHSFLGESGEILEKIIPSLKGKPLFWLDAHYCGEGSGWGKNETPILEELDAIKKSNIEDCIILIDDIRGFGTRIGNKEFKCWSNYPSIQELHNKLKEINNNFEFILLGDMLLAYDSKLYVINTSPVAHACTMSRLELTQTEEELQEIENTIRLAEGEERIFIETLYKNKKHYKVDNEYHTHLWYGLILLQNKKYQEAQDLFNYVIKCNYDHERIQKYLQEAIHQSK